MSIDPEISCPPTRTKLSAHPDFFMSADNDWPSTVRLVYNPGMTCSALVVRVSVSSDG
jgi:hypothetical protein